MAALTLLAAGWIVGIEGCASRRLDFPIARLRAHSLFVSAGESLLTISPTKSGTSGYVPRVRPADAVALSDHLEGLTAALDHERPRQIVIFVHGGLNDIRRKPAEIASRIRGASADSVFLYTINWDTGLLSSWLTHFGGKLPPEYWEAPSGYAARDRMYKNPVFSAYVAGGQVVHFVLQLGQDLLTAVGRAPLSIVPQAIQTLGRIHPLTVRAADSTITLFDERNRLRTYSLPKDEKRRPHLLSRIAAGEDDATLLAVENMLRSGNDSTWVRYLTRSGPAYTVRRRSNVTLLQSAVSWFNSAAGGILQLAFSIPIDALGRGPWQEMKRRSRDMPAAFSTRHGGALRDVLRRIRTYADSTRGVTVTLVGHSMGTMVASEMLATSNGLVFDEIVFMAAACPVRDYVTIITPYLERHPATRFWNLSLHPSAESNESHHAVDRGSLLEWIDERFEDPRSPLDHTLGRVKNWKFALLATPEALSDRVIFKSFDYHGSTFGHGRTYRPSVHGDFGRIPNATWDRSFWSLTQEDSLLSRGPWLYLAKMDSAGVRRAVQSELDSRSLRMRRSFDDSSGHRASFERATPPKH